MTGARPQFDQLYRELREPVGRLCLHVTGDRAAAEDAVQETFLAVLRALPAFRGEAQPSTWIYRIAVRAALKARSRRPLEAAEAEPVLEQPEAALAAREEVRRVAAAMAHLPAEHRVVLALFAVEGLSHKQIAEVLAIPEGTVWSRLHLARKRLAAALDEAGR